MKNYLFHRRAGQSLIETAMLLPVLAFLTFGLLDFGRAYYFQVAVTNAAREGARVAILNIYTGPQTPTCASSPWPYCPVQTDTAIRQAVQNEVSGTGIVINASQITICPPHDTADPACPNSNTRVANYNANTTNYYVTITTGTTTRSTRRYSRTWWATRSP
jgi:hypothetical protein